MTAMQAIVVLEVMLVLLGMIGIAFVHRKMSKSARPRAVRRKKAQIAEEVATPSALPAVPPVRQRRLVTDLPITYDPLAPRGEAAAPARTFADVERSLEVAFDDLQTGKISLETYRSVVEGEEIQVSSDMAKLVATEGEGSEAMQDAGRSMDLIKYCKDWRP